MGTVVGVFYSKATGRIRWELHPDHDEELSAYPTNKGEAVLTMSVSERSNYINPADLQAAISQKTGLIPSNDRYALVDGQNVIGVVFADTACGDKLTNGTVQAVKDDTAGIGYAYSNGVFVAPPLPIIVSDSDAAVNS